jgi:SAM-dependent methyltransferase
MAELVKLNLGCGPDIHEGYINADIVPLPGVDVVCDLDQPWPWKDSAASEVVACHVFEHVNDPVLFMAEAWRVLAPDGVLVIMTPHYLHRYAFTDPTHKRFCTELTWDYWTPGTNLHEAFGPGFGSLPGGPRFKQDLLFLAGEEKQEMRVQLRKME